MENVTPEKNTVLKTLKQMNLMAYVLSKLLKRIKHVHMFCTLKKTRQDKINHKSTKTRISFTFDLHIMLKIHG